MALASLLTLFLAVRVAARKTRRSWQEEAPSPQKLWLLKTFCTPMIWLGFFRRWMRWKLEKNPIGWLERRTWTGRLLTWSWLAIIISLYSVLLTDRSFFSEYSMMHRNLAWLLAGSVALSAAGSFRRERESGVLELLLVSPLGEDQLIFGRLRGLWGQFLPAFALLLGVWVYCASLYRDYRGSSVVFFAITFATLPVIGLYFSLICRNFITAFLATLAMGLLLPALLPSLGLLDGYLAMAYGARVPAGYPSSTGSGWLQLIIAVICFVRLRSRLRARAFPLERTAGQ
jgi:hypothetical protein